LAANFKTRNLGWLVHLLRKSQTGVDKNISESRRQIEMPGLDCAENDLRELKDKILDLSFSQR
jgi:hypothetical protein